jgi:hypothetical protein
MNITIPPLDAEQTTALSQLAANYDSPQKWGAAVLVGLINEQVVHNIDAKGAQLLEVAKGLPKEKRLDFTAQAETLLTTIATAP